MFQAIRQTQFGGPEVLVLEELPLPHPKPGEVLILPRMQKRFNDRTSTPMARLRTPVSLVLATLS